MSMWNLIKDIFPEENKLVLIFRHERKKYTLARITKNPPDEDGIEFYWVTQQNVMHPVNDNDGWMDFAYFVSTETYC